jgi:hypothetical protein
MIIMDVFVTPVPVIRRPLRFSAFEHADVTLLASQPIYKDVVYKDTEILTQREAFGAI